MEKLGYRRQWNLLVGWLIMLVHFLLIDCRDLHGKIPRTSEISNPPPELHLHIEDNQVVMDNGLLSVTISIPEGMVTGIQYSGIDNLLAKGNQHNPGGYWDVVWNMPGNSSNVDRLAGTNFTIVEENENQIEISFTKSWDVGLPLNTDKRYIMLRGTPGLYSYAIFERLEGWPDLTVDQMRIVFKLQDNRFHYMAISDQRQRVMPTPEDRENGQVLDYPEAVLLTNPTDSDLKGQVDDKYQYSCDNKDNRVHGWISDDPRVGFWMITPSDEFRIGGPLKQDLTSHVGPTTLAMFASTHYAGAELEIKLQDGEPWKKVFGPVFVYLNSGPSDENYRSLWEDAKSQMWKEKANWPYTFPLSEDFHNPDQRGTVRGQLLVRDRYINKELIPAEAAYIGLAPPGDAGSWQRENKGYQFWTRAATNGDFLIKGVRVGNYSLYAWVPGFIGDYKYNVSVTITPGCDIKLDNVIYEPPRNGPTLWEIGIPDRTAAEFYVPGPYQKLENPLYNINFQEQYGLWERYTDIYPQQDLIYTVGKSNYGRDWFFAHVPRDVGNHTYQATTWKIIFELSELNEAASYTLQLALASANGAELQIRVNDPNVEHLFTTGLIGKDNSIARHGIHGLYWLYSVGVPGSQLINGTNTIFLTQTRTSDVFMGLMYDYLRLEAPPSENLRKI